MTGSLQRFFDYFLKFATISLVGIGFFRIYISYSTIVTGYKIGELKQKEIQLLDQRSSINMEIEKLTTKDRLVMMADSGKAKIRLRDAKMASK